MDSDVDGRRQFQAARLKEIRIERGFNRPERCWCAGSFGLLWPLAGGEPGEVADV